MEAQKNDNEQCEKQRQDDSTSVLDDRALSTNKSNNKNGESVTKETTVDNGNSSDAIREHDPVIIHGSDGTSNLNELREPELLKDERTGIVKESENLESNLTTNPVEKLGEGTHVEKPSQPILSSEDVHMSDLEHAERTDQKQVPSHSAKTSKDLDDVPNPLPSVNEPQPLIAANSVKEASNDGAVVLDSHKKNETSQTETSNSVVDQGASMVSDSLLSADNAMPQPVNPNSVIESGAGTCFLSL